MSAPVHDTGRRVSVLVVALVVTVAGAGSVAALRADSGSTEASPSAPGVTATYTVTVVAERGDAVTRGGLKEVGLNFNADPDFSGSLANVTAQDVTVKVRDGQTGDTSRAGPVQVAANATRNRVWIGLESASQVEPGDEIVVEIADVTNTEIAIDDPSGPRGFALNVSVANPQGQVDGPVETRYSIDPNAQAPGTTPNTTSAVTPNGTTGTTGTGEGTTQTTTEATAMSTTAPGTGTTSSASSANATDTRSTGASGPGFGIVVAVVALLALGLFAMRRR